MKKKKIYKKQKPSRDEVTATFWNIQVIYTTKWLKKKKKKKYIIKEYDSTCICWHFRPKLHYNVT